MRILIPGIGSRGDVQPYLYLGRALRHAGHSVVVAAHANFADLIREAGLGFHPLAGDAQALHATETGRRMLNAGGNLFVYLRELVQLRRPLMARLLAGCYEASAQADAVLLTLTSYFLAYSAAEKRGLPVCNTAIMPTTPSRYLPNSLLPEAPGWLPGRGLYHLVASYGIGLYLWTQLSEQLNRARADVLGLPPLRLVGPGLRPLIEVPTLHSYSEHVVPRPSDWGAQHQLTGFWFADEEPAWRPSPALLDFLNSGPPPVSIGFGSMPHDDQRAITRLVVRALRRTGRRGILIKGWGGFDEEAASANVFVTGALPHDWLFPRVAAIVHHGGVGTTAAALRAGVPAVVVPFAGDQFFWGRRVHALGVSPRPIPRRRLTAGGLATALETALGDGAMRARAAALGRAIRAEQGVYRAAALLPELIKGPAAFPFAGAERSRILVPVEARVPRWIQPETAAASH